MQTYDQRQVLVTGGLGFIGSNLAIRLAQCGACVTVVDASIPGCGANFHNVGCVADRITVIHSNIADADSFAPAIRNAEVIFNLAGEVSHTHSTQFPDRDLQINVFAQMRFVEHCARLKPGVRIVYASTRQVYGVPKSLPVDESHPVQPVDFNGVHKHAAAGYHLMFGRTGQLDPVILRLSNVYGPRMALSVPGQGFLGTFLRNALLQQQIEVFGDGQQLRDPAYVDDVVDAFLLVGAGQRSPHRIYNVGGPEPLSLEQIGQIISETAGGVPIRKRCFPADRRLIDIGSYYTDTRLIQSDYGWRPVCRFRDAIVDTIAFYRSQISHYLDLAFTDTACQPLVPST